MILTEQTPLRLASYGRQIGSSLRAWRGASDEQPSPVSLPKQSVRLLASQLRTSSWHFDLRDELIGIGSPGESGLWKRYAQAPGKGTIFGTPLVASRLLVQNQCEGDSESWETKTRSVTAFTTLAGRTIVGPRSSSSRPRLAITMPTV